MRPKRKPAGKFRRKVRNAAAAAFIIAILMMVSISARNMSVSDLSGAALKTVAMKNVERYTPILERELQHVQLEEYTPVLAAVMLQESKGKGGDPMQASESAGLPPNAINDPEVSIKQGVKHFKRAVVYGQKKDVDLATVIQAYNMGLGYIDFVAEKGGKHNEEIAKEYSSIQVKKNPQTYDCGGDKENFRYPYCYGDFSYSTKVLGNLQASSLTAIEGKF